MPFVLLNMYNVLNGDTVLFELNRTNMQDEHMKSVCFVCFFYLTCTMYWKEIWFFLNWTEQTCKMNIWKVCIFICFLLKMYNVLKGDMVLFELNRANSHATWTYEKCAFFNATEQFFYNSTENVCQYVINTLVHICFLCDVVIFFLWILHVDITFCLLFCFLGAFFFGGSMFLFRCFFVFILCEVIIFKAGI